MVREGEVYNTELFSESIIRINDTGLYDLIDIDRDVDYRSEEAAILDLTIRLKKKFHLRRIRETLHRATIGTTFN